MVRFTSKCPPGVICISPGFILVAAIFLGIFGWVIMNRPPQIYQIQQDVRETPVPQVNVKVESGGDDRFNRAPKPERDWMARPDLSALTASSTNLPAFATRGIPETYQSMGILQVDGGEILPLFGRRTACRKDRSQYYTRTDSYNPVQLPLRHKNRNCEDDIGCEEIFDGDKLTVVPTGKPATATIYRFSGPTYIPIVA